MNELALFAGAGGGILGGKLLGKLQPKRKSISVPCAGENWMREMEEHKTKE